MTRSSPTHATLIGRYVLVGVAMLGLAGCGSDKSETGSADASPSARVSSSPTTSASSAPRQATDGTRLSACADGTCEVKVARSSTIPLDRKFKIDSIKVKSITADEISFTAIAASTANGYELNTSCGGAPCSTDIDNDVANIRAHAGTNITANRITIRVVSIAGGFAILRFTPG